MVDTVDSSGELADPQSHRRPTPWVDRVRWLLRGVGQMLITAGVIVLLFVVYEVYVTNYFADRAQAQVKTALKQEWQHTDGEDPLLPLPGQSTPSLPEGKGIAYLYIPRLGRDFGYAIVQGTSDADLEKGPGHYISTALPGQIGNFGVAGHRVGKGEPFLNLDQLQPGDPVIVQTESHWYVYRVGGRPGDISATDAQGVPGREIVDPSDGDVLDPVPDHPGAIPKKARLTMTTCHPKFTATQRMIVHATLAQTVPAHGLTMPASIVAIYSGQGA
ncbi:MAG TPA: class E sortase [Jatrophihabitans sp.]|jgi:sortase A